MRTTKLALIATFAALLGIGALTTTADALTCNTTYNYQTHCGR